MLGVQRCFALLRTHTSLIPRPIVTLGTHISLIPRPSVITLQKATFASATKNLSKSAKIAAIKGKVKKVKKKVVLKQKKPKPKRKDPLHHRAALLGSSTENIQKAIDNVRKNLSKRMPELDSRWVWIILNQPKITEEQRQELFNMTRTGVPVHKSPSVLKRIIEHKKQLQEAAAANGESTLKTESDSISEAKSESNTTLKAESDSTSEDKLESNTTLKAESDSTSGANELEGGHTTKASELESEHTTEASEVEGENETKGSEEVEDENGTETDKEADRWAQPYWNKEKADYKKELKRVKYMHKDPPDDESADGLYPVYPPKPEPEALQKKPKIYAKDRPKLLGSGLLYIKMITTYLAKQQWDKVEEIVKLMKRDNKIERMAYYHMLRNALQHAPERVDAIIQDMKDVNIPIDENVYARYIEFYDKRNEEEKMLEVFAKMAEEKILPTPHSYTRLVARYLRKREYAKALAAHRDMRAKNLKLNGFILPAFIDAYASNTLPKLIFGEFLAEVRAQPGAILNLARKLANKMDAHQLAVLNELRKKFRYNGIFRHEWDIHSRLRRYKVQALEKKKKEAAEGKPTEEKQTEKQ